MKNKQASLSKEERMLHLALCLFSLEASKGHLKWKVTDVERKSGISRTLIYRYFGSSRQEFLISALAVFSDAFYGFSKEQELDLPSLIGHARKMMTEHHEAILFYQRWRSRESFLTGEFRRIEKRFQTQLSKALPNLSGQQIMLAHACIHGLVTAPFLSSAQSHELAKMLRERGVF